MLTFKQFQEEWKRGSPVSSNKSYGRKWALHHSAKVGRHDVNVIISHHDKEFDSKESKGDVSADFQVNGSFDKQINHPTKEEGKQILHHVHKVLKHYIERRKPRSVTMSGNTKAKSETYEKYAKHLAKKVGGRVQNFGKEKILGTILHLGKNK